MSSSLNRQQIAADVFFNSVNDTRFKTNRISVHMAVPLQADTASDCAAVPLILRKGTRECPDFTKLNERLEELYGAYVGADVSKLGGNQVLSLTISGLDDRFALQGEKVAEACTALLCGMLLDPVLENGVFTQTDAALERQSVVDAIDAELSDKRQYAVNRCKEIMGEGSPFGIARYGSRETAGKITAQSAFAAYRRLLKTARIEILFIGCGDPNGARAVFERAFAGVERAPAALAAAGIADRDGDIKEVTDTLDVNQGKLVLGFRAGTKAGEPGVDACRLMTALYGGTPFSRLFLNVREKLSLCYYCAARFDRISGVLLVDSGVEAANKDKAKDEILRQLEVLQHGKFEENELAQTKLALAGSFKSITDTPGGIESWYLSQALSGELQSPEQEAARIEALTKQDVMDAAAKVRLDTVYFLTGKEADDHE